MKTKIDKLILAILFIIGGLTFLGVALSWGGSFGFIVAGVYFVGAILVLKT